uniref:Uncharacterized protein n=1 Tax=Solanum tuberosum TaxID=4113 RepID=M1DJ49_SOLTU
MHQPELLSSYCLLPSVLDLYAPDVNGRCRSDLDIPLLIMRNSSMPSQLCNQDRERKKRLALLGSHGHLLLFDESQVKRLPGYYGSETGRLWVDKDGLVLQRNDRVVDEPKPLPSGNIQVLLLDGSSCFNPHQCGIRNQGGKPTL